MGFSDELKKHKRLVDKDNAQDKAKRNSIYQRLSAMPYTHWRMYFDVKYNYIDLRREPRKEYEFKYIEKE